jgi:hypothetical protein
MQKKIVNFFITCKLGKTLTAGSPPEFARLLKIAKLACGRFENNRELARD